MKNSFPVYYCPKHLWLCLSIGTFSVASLTLLLLFGYHYHRYSRKKEHKQMIVRLHRDEQVNELLRSTPILPFEQTKFNEVNQIQLQPLHSFRTDLPAKPNGIHNR